MLCQPLYVYLSFKDVSVIIRISTCQATYAVDIIVRDFGGNISYK